jgi:hypothetical protein
MQGFEFYDHCSMKLIYEMNSCDAGIRLTIIALHLMHWPRLGETSARVGGKDLRMYGSIYDVP